MTARKTKGVVEMFGEFFREAAVLVPVFFRWNMQLSTIRSSRLISYCSCFPSHCYC
jgi:hypothetical protein